MVDGEVGLTMGPAAPPVGVANRGGRGSAIIQPQPMEETPVREPRSSSKTATMNHVQEPVTGACGPLGASAL